MNPPTPPRSWYSDQTLEERKAWYSPVADAYNRVRPRYPQALTDRILEVTHLSTNARILEVGCGPGTATTTFAQFGFSMVCLEPNQDAYQLAQRNCESYPNTNLINTTFEEWQLEPEQFDAILAATSFHWVSPAVGYPKAAAALRHQGFLILLWNMSLQPTYEVYQALDQVYQTHAPSLAGYETRAMQNESLNNFEQTVLNSGWFEKHGSKQLVCQVAYSIRDYLALLSTYSPYIALKPQQRESLFQELQVTLGKICGETVLLSYLSAFQLFRKR